MAIKKMNCPGVSEVHGVSSIPDHLPPQLCLPLIALKKLADQALRLSEPLSAQELNHIIGQTRKILDMFDLAPDNRRGTLARRRRLLKKSALQRAVIHQNAGTKEPLHPFLQKMQVLLEKRYADFRFQVDDFAREAGLSKAQLHRKLTVLTGASAGLFIRSFRLQKAMALLRHSELNISEIAYDCGFSTPAHFTHTFTRLFGYCPSAYRAFLRK